MYNSAANYLQYYLLLFALLIATSVCMTGSRSTMMTQLAVGSPVTISSAPSLRIKGLSSGILLADRATAAAAAGERGTKSIPAIRTETDGHHRRPSNQQPHAKPNFSSISSTSDSTRGKTMTGTTTYYNYMPGKTDQDESSTSSSGDQGRQFKVCLTHGPCHKKKLICPKKCKKPLNGIDPNHTYARCVFNCKKCIAHC